MIYLASSSLLWFIGADIMLHHKLICTGLVNHLMTITATIYIPMHIPSALVYHIHCIIHTHMHTSNTHTHTHTHTHTCTQATHTHTHTVTCTHMHYDIRYLLLDGIELTQLFSTC